MSLPSGEEEEERRGEEEQAVEGDELPLQG